MERIAIVTAETGETFIWLEEVPMGVATRPVLLFTTSVDHASNAMFKTETEALTHFGHLPSIQTMPAAKSILSF